MNACLNGLGTFRVVNQVARNAINHIAEHLAGRSGNISSRIGRPGKKYMYIHIEIGAISWVLEVHECMFKWSRDLPKGL